MKKILLFIDSLVSGGAQRQIVGLAVLLKDRGYDVKVLTYYPLDFYKADLDKESIPNVCVDTGRNFFLRVMKVQNEINRFSPEIVISFLDTPNKIACALKALTFPRWKLIVSERNTTTVLSKREKTKFKLFRWADIIVPNSKSQARFIAKYFPQLADKTVTITNFVDTNYFSPDVDSLQGNGIKRIICVGRIIPQKNIFNFLRAIRIFKNKDVSFVFDWFGGRPDKSYFEKCETLIKELKIGDVFSFHMPDRNIRDRYRESDVFCLPSLYEGYPNVLCEAMSCGLPVICSNVCDNPDIMVDGKSGFLFDPEDIDSIVNAIIRVVSLDESEFRAMGNFNRKLAMRSFSTHKFLDNYLNLINNLLEK